MKLSVFILVVLLQFIAFFISPSCASSTVNSTIPATGSPVLIPEPLDPGFRTYMDEMQKRDRSIPLSGNGSDLGGLPSMYAPQVKDVEMFDLNTEEYEPNFDLRFSGKVTGVRSQGSWNTGWAHSSLASLESTLRPGETYDFSEKNMVNIGGGSFLMSQPGGGGNNAMAAAYLTRWSGPVLETTDPYPSGSWTGSSIYAPVKHVKDIIWLPARSDRSNTNNFKGALKTWGAISSGYWWETQYYRIGTCSYYMPETAERGISSSNIGNFATIIGWDDNYPAGNFNTAPPGNGAWIVKSSFGTSFGYDGFFYVSYYDKYFASSAVTGQDLTWDSVVFVGDRGSPLSRVYSYDPLGRTGSLQFGGNIKTAYMANIFTFEQNLWFDGVGFYTNDINVAYEISFYKNPTSTPISGSYIGSFSGVIPQPGYHTVYIPWKIQSFFIKGEKIAIIVKVTNPTNPYTMPIEGDVSGYSNPTATAGQSYYSLDGSNWADLALFSPNTNFCIKGIYDIYQWGNPTHSISIFRNGMWLIDYNRDYGWSGTNLDRMGSLGQSGDTVLAGRLNSDITSDICLFRSGMWLIDYDGNYQWGGTSVDRMGALGQAGDTPLLGDWNGDKKKEIGIFRNGMWLLDYDGDFGWGGTDLDKMGTLGQAGDIPVVGDWNGDNFDEIGIFRNGMWLLDYNRDYGWSGNTLDRMGALGQAGDIPVIGKWNIFVSDLRENFGIFRNGMWLLDYTGNYQWSGAGSTESTDRMGWLGQAGDTPFIGNWNGGYKDEIGIFRSGMWLLDYDGNLGWSGAGTTDITDRIGWLGQTGDTPIIGNWDGLGISSVESAFSEPPQSSGIFQIPNVSAPAVPDVKMPLVQTSDIKRPVVPGEGPASPLLGGALLSAGVKIL